jgi:hypothetical protein
MESAAATRGLDAAWRSHDPESRIPNPESRPPAVSYRLVGGSKAGAAGGGPMTAA